MPLITVERMEDNSVQKLFRRAEVVLRQSAVIKPRLHCLGLWVLWLDLLAPSMIYGNTLMGWVNRALIPKLNPPLQCVHFDSTNQYICSSSKLYYAYLYGCIFS